MKQYENYKPSGVEFIGDIPEHWEVRKLKYCMRDKITDGPHETPKFISEGVPFLSVDGIQNGELVFENCRKISEEAHKEYSKKALIEYDDILLGKAASIGKIARVKVDFEFSIWSPLALIKANKEVVLPTFLEYSLKTKMVQYQIETLATNNTQKNISMADIPRFILTVPSLQEQEKIANFLDTKNQQIEEFIKEKQNQIALLEEQKEAIANKAVTKGLDDSITFKDSGIEWIGDIPEHWDMMKITHNFYKIGSGTTPLTSNSDYYDNGTIYWVNSGDLNNSFIKGSSKLITKKAIDEVSSLKMHEKGALIIAMYGATIGKLGILDIQASVNQACCVLNGSDNMMNKFAFYWFLVNKQNIINLGIGGGQPNISQDIIKSLRIQTPPRNEQIKIIEYIEASLLKIDKAISQIQKEIDLIKEYKISLISEVVTGQIDVR